MINFWNNVFGIKGILITSGIVFLLTVYLVSKTIFTKEGFTE